MAGKAFTNLNKIFLSDTFRAWFDKTNQIITTINPLEIYGVTADKGELAGITFSVNSDGIVTFGLDLPNSLTGDFTFTSGVTFANFVHVSGLTVDFAPNGGHGATLTGRVVRTINGQTGDITLTHVNTPGNSADGDILVYEGTGATYAGYNLFSDGAFSGAPLHIGVTGGLFAGITAGGVSAAYPFIKEGNIQLLGATSSGVYLSDNTQSVLSTSKHAGADIRYSGKQLTIGGRNISGTRYSSDNLVIDFNRQTLAVAGAATGEASLVIGDKAKASRPITYVDQNGSTFSIKYLIAGETGPGRTSGGFTGVGIFGGNPSTKGLNDDQRVRLEYTAGSVEVEITGSGKTSGFAVMGKEESGGPYGDLLLPTLVARRDGNVVIGGIAPSDGGITGTTFGGLNIASGKLYIGGNAGSSVSTGMQVLATNGSTAGWKTLSSTAFSFSGTITDIMRTSRIPDTGDIPFNSDTGQTIVFANKNGVEQTGPFTVQVNFPMLKLFGQYTTNSDAVIGVFIDVDGVRTEMQRTVRWKDIHASGIEFYAPTFVASGNANKRVRITPFATVVSDPSISKCRWFYFCCGRKS